MKSRYPLSARRQMTQRGAYGEQPVILSADQAQGKDTNSIMQGWVDRGPWQYWDTITFAAATQVNAQYSPFSVPIGSLDPLSSPNVKSKLQTNMQRGNQFPPPRCLLLIAIGFVFSPSFTKADINKITDGAYMEFRIDDKIFHEGPLELFPGGAGVFGVTENSGESSYYYGFPTPQTMRRYGDWAKYIAPLQQFSMTINFGGGGVAVPTLTTGGVLRVYLDGLTDRSVQ